MCTDSNVLLQQCTHKRTGEEKAFFTIPEYIQWASQHNDHHKQWTVKYFKVRMAITIPSHASNDGIRAWVHQTRKTLVNTLEISVPI